MKRVLLLLLLVLPLAGFARNADLFRYDAHKVSLQLVAVNQLNRFVEARHARGASLHFDKHLWGGYRNQSALPDDNKEKTWGNTSFLMGCLLGVIGVLIVYLVTENGHEVEKALWGMVASYVITGACIGLIFLGSAVTALIAGD